jgi:hypothetical protein
LTGAGRLGTGSWTAGAAAIAVRNILHLQP